MRNRHGVSGMDVGGSGVSGDPGEEWFASPTRTAMAGGALLVPALVVVSGGTIPLPLPGLLTHPVLVLGGLAAALLLNLLEVLRLEIAAGEGRIEAHLEFLGRDRLPNLSVVAISLLGLALLVMEQAAHLWLGLPPGPG